MSGKNKYSCPFHIRRKMLEYEFNYFRLQHPEQIVKKKVFRVRGGGISWFRSPDSLWHGMELYNAQNELTRRLIFWEIEKNELIGVDAGQEFIFSNRNGIKTKDISEFKVVREEHPGNLVEIAEGWGREWDSLVYNWYFNDQSLYGQLNTCGDTAEAIRNWQQGMAEGQERQGNG